MTAPQGASSATLHHRIVRDGESDSVAIEEPLEIRIDGEPLAVTMRTPGHDEELAAGFLYGEGLVAGAPEVSLTEDLAANTVDVRGPLLRDPGARRFYTTSSCGVCGKGALEQVAVDAPMLPDGPRLSRSLLAALPERLVQPGFQRTGGLHATGLFDAAGELLCVREDVGRHNAMDKVVGWALAHGLVPLHGNVLCVSGRLSFELVQKAAVAGAPFLVGVGAPTSLAVDLSAERRLTLCGFARRGRVNVYTSPERVLEDATPRASERAEPPREPVGGDATASRAA
ncbi:MAG: formate dehydrogenase family accessory protein FdhD [Solirubrobacterales bacterium]|nr:formate dehydrogenase family accessory protein FdhD [Solirubrobacterales bacterium]